MLNLTEDIRDKIYEMTAQIAGDFGLEIFELKVARINSVWKIRIVLDQPDGVVGVADCSQVSKRLMARLDLEQIIDPDYSLEVGSPGLDRHLRGIDDYKRFVGKLAKFTVSAERGTDVIIGRILRVEDDIIILGIEDAETELQIKNIRKSRLEPELPEFPVSVKGKSKEREKSKGKRKKKSKRK